MATFWHCSVSIEHWWQKLCYDISCCNDNVLWLANFLCLLPAMTMCLVLETSSYWIHQTTLIICLLNCAAFSERLLPVRLQYFIKLVSIYKSCTVDSNWVYYEGDKPSCHELLVTKPSTQPFPGDFTCLSFHAWEWTTKVREDWAALLWAHEQLQPRTFFNNCFNSIKLVVYPLHENFN